MGGEVRWFGDCGRGAAWIICSGGWQLGCGRTVFTVTARLPKKWPSETGKTVTQNI